MAVLAHRSRLAVAFLLRKHLIVWFVVNMGFLLVVHMDFQIADHIDCLPVRMGLLRSRLHCYWGTLRIAMLIPISHMIHIKDHEYKGS